MVGQVLHHRSAVRPRYLGNRRRASTLIELLVVVFMIGILISILLPSLRRSMDLARGAICQSNLRSVGQVLTQYQIENEGWIPSVDRFAAGIASTAVGVQEDRPTNRAWFFKLFPTYLQDPMVLTCPEDPYNYRMSNARTRLEEPYVAEYASYGLNSFMLRAGGGFLANVERHKPRWPRNTILVADLGPDIVRFGRTAPEGVGPARNQAMMMWTDGLDPFSGRAANPWVTTRHNHGMNALTLTMDVRSVRTKEVLESPIRRRYEDCASGGCTLCNELGLFHYSFAKDRLFWWTGPTPTP